MDPYYKKFFIKPYSYMYNVFINKNAFVEIKIGFRLKISKLFVYHVFLRFLYMSKTLFLHAYLPFLSSAEWFILTLISLCLKNKCLNGRFTSIVRSLVVVVRWYWFVMYRYKQSGCDLINTLIRYLFSCFENIYSPVWKHFKYF